MTEQMKTFHVRTLLSLTTEQLWECLIGKFKIRFDDNEEIETNYRETLYSSYFWDFFRKYPDAPVFKRHHVTTTLRGKPLSSKTHIELLADIYWDVIRAYGITTARGRDPFVKLIYEVTNNCYVEMAKKAEPFIVSIDTLDFIEVIRHPKARAVLDNIQPNREDIVLAYKVLMEILTSDPDMSENALARAVRSKMVNSNQVLQCVGPRGYLTEVDGVLMPTPVTRSYTQGLRSLHNMIAESRSAAKALYFSEAPLEDAEYFARRLQLGCMTVERAAPGDCGSTKYVLWPVKPPRVKNGETVYVGDLEFIQGMYYMDDETNQLKVVTTADKHLYGKSIRLRTALGCCHANKHEVCEVCFGAMSEHLTPEDNLGHICAATMTRQTSQSVLSTKHYDANSSAEPIALSLIAEKYFSVGKGGSTYVFKKPPAGTTLRMTISKDDLPGLTDVNTVSDVRDLSLDRVAQIENVGFNENNDPMVEVKVAVGARKGMFTRDFLAYIKKHGWFVDEHQNFVFELTGWDWSKQAIAIPEMEYSFSQHSSQVAKVIESSMKNIGDRLKPNSAGVTLIELHDLVNSKLNVNVACLAVIIYASMIADGSNDQYGLARNSPTASLGVADKTIWCRSLSPQLAYKKQHEVVIDPRSFYLLDRPDSVFDAFIDPKSVVERYKKLGIC